MVSDAALTRVTESLRLEAVRSLNHLPHAVPLPALDALAQAAARICDAPMALVSLVDANDVFIAARVGIDRDRVAREGSFCSHTIEGSDVFEVRDARADDRFWQNPLVIGTEGARSYAGAPMTSATGHAIGTLCVLDRISLVLSEQQHETLRALAAACVEMLESAARHREQEAWFAQTLDTVLDAVISVNPRGAVNYANPAALELLDLQAPDVFARPIEAVLGLVGPGALVHPVRECLRTRKSLRDEGVAVTHDGLAREIDYAVTAVTTDAGVDRGAVVVFRSVGQPRRSGEGAAGAVNAELEVPELVDYRRPPAAIVG